MNIEASCGCNIGRIRRNNEDNFYFCGESLACINPGLENVITASIKTDSVQFFAVFDGMGGEESGEVASYISAQTAGEYLKTTKKNDPEDMLNEMCILMNRAVCKESRKLDFGIMGSTLASVMFENDKVYCCNIGDSRVYRLRDNDMVQLSQDHVERLPANAKHKARLIQNIGIPEDEMRIEPYISSDYMRKDDCYLICSDGLTDMVRNDEIVSIMKSNDDVKIVTEELISAALKNGGRDNTTVIFCRVK